MDPFEEKDAKEPETGKAPDALLPETAGEKSEPKFEEPAFSEPAAPEPGEPEAPATKLCVFCGSEIRLQAMRCPHCAGFLPIAEGTTHKQYFFFLFSCLTIAIGCFLPWERTSAVFNLRGIDSIGGGFLLAFAAYGVISAFWNIYHRRMIAWPVLLAGVEGALIGWSRMIQIGGKVVPVVPPGASKMMAAQLKFKAYYSAFGPGLYLVTLFSSLLVLSIVISVFKGARQEAARKAQDREARASRSRRSL